MAEVNADAEGGAGAAGRAAGMDTAEVKRQSRRGILFSLSALLLSICLLSLSFYIARNSAESQSTVNSLLDIDRSTDAFFAVEGALAEIVSVSANYTSDGSTLRAGESLPYAASISTALERFSLFEQGYSDENVSMSLEGMKAGSFLIQPGAINLTHQGGGFSVSPTAASQGEVLSYDMDIIFPTATLDNAYWSSVTNAMNASDSLPVRVRVRDSRYAVIIDTNETLSRSSTSVLNITELGSSVGSVTFSPNAGVEVLCARDIGLKASIGFTTPVFVEANDVISVVSAANKTGRPRLS
jgi:hypothetical protein